MSRSKRKPYHTQGYGGKWRKTAKKLANKRVRNNNIADNGDYKKQYNSWDICDWSFKDENNYKVRRK